VKKKIFGVAVVVSILLLLCAVVAFFFPQKFLCVDSGPVKADVIVVLGGGGHERPRRAAELFKEHAAPHVIVSGRGDDLINREILIKNGVPASAIQIEPKSRTTKENAQLTIKMLRQYGWNHAIIVTSWYHSRRALACFRHYAPEMKFYSRPSYFDISRADWTRVFANRVRLEYIKLAGYWVCYGVRPF
jgi:uncharacterized SAM-binding protein YcdF (DUF218 family)